MEPVREVLRSAEIDTGKEHYILKLYQEDFSALYPGMIRYTVMVMAGEDPIAVFRTNSFEYSPGVPFAAGNIATQIADEWEREIASNPMEFILNHRQGSPEYPVSKITDLVVIQGSPRGDGNCSILAEWAVEAAYEVGRTAQVIYPHDMNIHCCIGCYQCYNTGTCVFDDDMGTIIGSIRAASLLIVCSPVYTNTVTAGLKLVIDRCQAYHAERVLYGGRTGQKGLVFSVAGRKGGENFTCIIRVILAFLRNLDFDPVGEILIDRVDAIRDIRNIPGMEQTVKKKVKQNLINQKR
ncbi:MAG: flavodoxin family protein [Methanoregula sp.]|nr:flavodoxin family protein [Methanoregula sp.]